MFLGIPLDYRNTFDIANAVATFRTYQNWHHDDEVLHRTLVFASYPSAATVPRDVVFGWYANLGVARESWTAPCYVLNGVFANIVAPDEDPMPFDGNPHPLPGQLLPNNNLLVMPHYPELGWQVDPNVQQNNGQAGLFEEEVQDNMQDDVEEMMMDSIVLNPSSTSIANQQLEGEVNQLAHVVQLTLQIGVVRTFFGPELPPALLWDRNFKHSTYSLFYADIQKPVFQFSIDTSPT
jgi:hypothetical protein